MTNKYKYFIGNWKMFGDFASLKIIHQINKFCYKYKKINKKSKIIICIPSTLINFFTNQLKSKFVSIGAQNCHYENTSGPFTGSISAAMLKEVGAKYVILGHAENRAEGDTNQIIKKKIKSALDQKLHVVFCIGENFKEKVKNKTYSILKKQITSSIDKNFNLKKIILAYEPIWSIGTGKVPKNHEIQKVMKFIKKEFRNRFKTKMNTVVLYGGSVNNKTISMLSSVSEIDGFLIGGASQSSKKFIDIIKNYYK